MSSSIVEKVSATSSIRDYWCLLKPKIMYLVVFTGMTGLLISPGLIHPLTALISILCIALGSGSAGAINMWYDSDIDAIMTRTKSRPIPSGKIKRESALEFGLVLAVISVFVMTLTVNYTAGLLLAISIAFYIVIYTMWLKRSTPQNIVIGGAAGAFPPMIGWASVSNSISWESFILFIIIFMWTPPHFWALSLLNYKEYEKAKVPMLPVIYGLQKTRTYIMVYSIALVMVTLLPGLFINNPIVYEISSIILGALFLKYAVNIIREKNNTAYKKLFTYSIYYLFALFSSIIFCGIF